MKHSYALTALSMALLLSACGGEKNTDEAHGPDPKCLKRSAVCCPA